MMPYPEGKGRAVINRGGARGSRAASWLIWPCTTRARSIRHPALADQPGVDELPFVPASGLEVEQWGPAVLQLEEELQRLAPVAALGSMDWLCSHLFHSGIINALASFCFIRRSNILLSLERLGRTRADPAARGDTSVPSIRRWELNPKPIELLLQPGGGAGYAAARGDLINRTEGSNQPPRLFLHEHNMTEAI